MNDALPDEYYGVLARARFGENHAVLRFCSFTFDTNPDGKPIYEVTLDQPAFGEADLEPFLGQEVEFSRVSEPAQIHDIFAGLTLDLVASRSVATVQPYDRKDYADRVAQLDLLNDQLSKDLQYVRSRLSKVQSTAIELLRRAEIKSAGSADLKRLQAPAIEVLRRILSDLE